MSSSPSKWFVASRSGDLADGVFRVGSSDLDGEGGTTGARGFGLEDGDGEADTFLGPFPFALERLDGLKC